MTLAAVSTYSGPYTATAGQDTFPYAFLIFSDAAAELEVVVDGALASQSLYSVSGVGDPAGGTIIFTTPMAGGEVVIASAKLPLEQTASYPPAGPFPAALHESAMDRLMRVMQVDDLRTRYALRFALPTLLGTGVSTLLPAPTTGALHYDGPALGTFSWVPMTGGAGGSGLPDQTGLSGFILSTDGASPLWVAQPPSIPSFVSGQLLSNDGANLLWTVAPTGLPVQATHNGKLLTTNGTAASWALLSALMPQPLQSGYVLSNNGTSLQWVTSAPGSLPALPAAPAPGAYWFLSSDGSTAYWDNTILPNHAAAANQRLAVSGDGLSLLWLPAEVADQATHGGKLLTTDGSVTSWLDPAAIGLPAQAGHAGKALSTDGALASWETLFDLLPSGSTGEYLQHQGGSLAWVPPELPTLTATLSLLQNSGGGTPTLSWQALSQIQGGLVVASDYVGSGADDTEDLQNAFDAAENQILIIDVNFAAVTSVTVKDHTTVWFHPGVFIGADAAQSLNTGLLHISGKVDISIYGSGAHVNGNGLFSLSNRYGVYIYNSTRILIDGLEVLGHGGSGIFVTESGGVTHDVELRNCRSATNNHAGIEMVSGKDIRVTGGYHYQNGIYTDSNSACAGVLVRPAASGNRLDNLLIEGVMTLSHGFDGGMFNDFGAGLLLDFAAWDGLTNAATITVRKHHSLGVDVMGIRLIGQTTGGGPVGGFIRIEDCLVQDTAYQGISLEGPSIDGPPCLLSSPIVHNANSWGAPGDLTQRCGIFVGTNASGDGPTIVGNIRIGSASVIDPNGTATCDHLIRVNGFSNNPRGVYILNPRHLEWSADGSKLPREAVYFYATQGAELTDGNRILRHLASTSETIEAASGTAIWSASANATYTLGTTIGGTNGVIQKFEVDTDDVRLRIQPQATHRIQGGGDNEWIEARRAGAKLYLQKASTTLWKIVHQVGDWRFTSEGAELGTTNVTGVTTETTLDTYTLAANAMLPGDEVWFRVGGIVFDPTGTRTYRLKVDGTELVSTIQGAGTDTPWEMEVNLLFVSTTAVRYRARLFLAGILQDHAFESLVISTASAIPLLATVQPSSATSDLTRTWTTRQIIRHAQV